MHISRVDLNLFVVFEAIYSEGGISRAAKALNITQPAVSHALNRLRQLFDDPLFEREGRGMKPTPRARSMISEVRRSLRSLELSLHESQGFQPLQAEREFVIGTRGAVESAILSPLAQVLETQAPKVEVSLIRSERRQMEAELAAGRMDVALDILQPVSKRLRQRRLSQDKLVVLLRQNHPLM